MRNKRKILMVCLGNICRSPLAHGIMEHMVRAEGLDWEVDSAGTGNWHVGEAPDHRSIATARKYGVDISGQCCRQFTYDDFEVYDSIYVMDHNNYKDVLNLARTDVDREKVKLFLGSDIVPDPYYDDGMFDAVYQMIERRCRELIRQEIAR